MTDDSSQKTDGTQRCDSLTVMFDGSCPLCRREVNLYRGLVPLQPLLWLDVSTDNPSLAVAQEKSRLMARFHVRRADGELLSGAKAFVALWLQLPGWRWLGRAASLPGATALLELFYVTFLRIRPALQRIAVACESRK
jgi:predicted DCC family thiol-disulfide oxidoreductase YuxK